MRPQLTDESTDLIGYEGVMFGAETSRKTTDVCKVQKQTVKV